MEAFNIVTIYFDPTPLKIYPYTVVDIIGANEPSVCAIYTFLHAKHNFEAIENVSQGSFRVSGHQGIPHQSRVTSGSVRIKSFRNGQVDTVSYRLTQSMDIYVIVITNVVYGY